MEKPEQLTANPRRNILRMVVGNILNEIGFGKVEKQCIESLTEVSKPKNQFPYDNSD